MMGWEKPEIHKEISSVFQQHAGIPLFYIESGSRLWRMASPDSDYDVRGMHLQTKEQYFDYRSTRDVIEVSTGLFDFVSFDIDKFFRLVANSNPNCIEWLGADIIYFEEFPELGDLRTLVFQNFANERLFRHYLSLAGGNLLKVSNGVKPTYKTLLYALRGIASAEVAARGILPKLIFDELLHQTELGNDLLEVIRICLNKKKQSVEKTNIDNLEELFPCVQHGFMMVKEMEIAPHGNSLTLEQGLKLLSHNIKSRFYR